MWDEDRARLPVIPIVGDLVVISAQVRVRLVEVERLDDDGETISESFERRDVTVKRVARVPVQDPVHVSLAPVGTLVVPEPVQGRLALDPEPVAVHAPADAPEVLHEPADVDPGESGAFGDWSGDEFPIQEPPADRDFEPARSDDEPRPTRHLHVVAAAAEPEPEPGPQVVHLAIWSRIDDPHEVTRAVASFGLPAGFCEPDGGAWAITTGTGQTVVVTTGAAKAPDAAHLQVKAAIGWSALSLPQAAAA
jgi:hypothetical protein